MRIENRKSNASADRRDEKLKVSGNRNQRKTKTEKMKTRTMRKKKHVDEDEECEKETEKLTKEVRRGNVNPGRLNANFLFSFPLSSLSFTI